MTVYGFELHPFYRHIPFKIQLFCEFYHNRRLFQYTSFKRQDCFSLLLYQGYSILPINLVQMK